ncbi:MAG: dephospho-CoA kinase [SAR202 cluster bacterium]|nr:dephospho-CoA kinase [SAR202 cluster bacterium]
MITIGLTGGIGTGKSTVAAILKELGAEVIDADKVGHEVYRNGAPGWAAVVSAFGEGILAENGEVDRRKLGAIVFADKAALEHLNAIVHPLIRERVQAMLDDARARGVEVAVVEAAVMVESRWSSLVDEIWVTDAAEERAIERVCGRNGLTEEAVRARIKSQMPQSRRILLADVVIENNGSKDELQARVEALWRDRAPQIRKRKSS